jgi:2-polyprenyl-3-methyl-5-hydroxy-6-metoxy-1,4-benzoquinol methylase
MIQSPSGLDYSRKEDVYFAHARPEMLGFVPTKAKHVLDVGCGIGLFGETVRQRNRAVVYGVEIELRKAEAAKARLDHVIVGPYDEKIELPECFFDCIVFNDVLEHLLDPWAALRLSQRFLKPGGSVVASVPNVQHFPTAWKLLVQGRWEYMDWGILDITHLRFFTKAGICELLKKSGYQVEQIEGINEFACCARDDLGLWKYYKVFRWFLPSKFQHGKYLQYAVVAKVEEAG